MRDLALFVKSYRRDHRLIERLLASTAAHNSERLPVFVTVPSEDLRVFTPLVRSFPDVTLIADEYFHIPGITDKIWHFGPGYIAQQLIKLSVHELNEARNYVMLDSDSYFIRDFSAADFLAPDGVGFTVVSPDSDLNADPAYDRFRAARREKIALIASRLGVDTWALATCHNNAIFQDVVLRSLAGWRASEGLSLLDMMRIAPVEFTWYHLFLQRHHPDLIHKIEPFIKMVHTRSEYRRLVKAGFSHDSLARSYLGACLNSGWAGSNQRRYVSRLERGSRSARIVLRADQARYTAAQHLQLFIDARLQAPLRLLETALRR